MRGDPVARAQGGALGRGRRWNGGGGSISEEEEKRQVSAHLSPAGKVGSWVSGGVASRRGNTFIALPSATRSHSWGRRPESALEVGAGEGLGREREGERARASACTCVCMYVYVCARARLCWGGVYPRSGVSGEGGFARACVERRWVGESGEPGLEKGAWVCLVSRLSPEPICI